MAAKKGNSYWRLRLSHGRKAKINTPTQLLNAAVDYLEFLEANPLLGMEVVKHQGDAFNHEVPKMRAPTLQGLWIHLGIGRQTWYDMKKRKGFPEVCRWIEDAFYDWKFQGAAAGLLNHAIIARDLGLADKTDLTSGGEPLRRLIVSYD